MRGSRIMAAATLVSGPGRGQRHGAVRRRQQGLDDEVDGVHVGQRHHRGAKAGAVEAGFAVNLLRRHQLPLERCCASGVNADIGTAGQFANAPGVGLRVGQGHIAGHHRDPQHVNFIRRGEGQQERHGIIVAGVAVDDDGARRHVANFGTPRYWSKSIKESPDASRSDSAFAPSRGR